MILDYKNDIYFDPRLGKIYAAIEGGRFHEFNYKNDYGSIRHQFIIRPIEIKAAYENSGLASQAYYDLTTPYGYGGPLIMEVKPDRKKELLDGFAEAFAEFCKKENIVSEFVRFHILAGNAEDFSAIYETELFNHTVGIDLAGYDDPFQEEFTKSARKSVRRCLRSGLTWEMEEYPDTLEDFAEIYYQTMDRNEAGSSYYFDADYFDAFIRTMPEAVLKCRVLYEGKTIAMGFYLRSADILHTHLSGTLTEYLHLSPAYILRYGLTHWGKEQGYKLIHNGGGTSGDPEDSLFRFKKQFSKNTEFDFYIGRKVWDEKIYRELVEVSGKSAAGFFPQYRAEI